MLAWRSQGPEDSPPLVLLHGLTETMRCWDRIVPLLADRFRVVLVDLPGHGESGGGGRGVSIESYAESVADVLREAGVQGATVAGHSLGGAVAIALAERSPELVERIVLVNSPPTYDSRLTTRKGPERVMRQPVIGPVLWWALPEKRVRDGLQSAFAPGYQVPPEFLADLRATSWSTFAGATTALDEFLAERDLGRRAAALRVPVRVVFGEQDQRVEHGSLGVFDDAQNATILRVPDAGHTPIWEAPERTSELIADA